MAETHDIGGLKTTVNSGFETEQYGSSFQNIERDLFIMTRMAKAVKEPEGTATIHLQAQYTFSEDV